MPLNLYKADCHFEIKKIIGSFLYECSFTTFIYCGFLCRVTETNRQFSTIIRPKNTTFTRFWLLSWQQLWGGQKKKWQAEEMKSPKGSWDAKTAGQVEERRTSYRSYRFTTVQKRHSSHNRNSEASFVTSEDVGDMQLSIWLWFKKF